jgi:hypothetical protein
MGQKAGEKWTAVVDLQQTTPTSDRLLEKDAIAARSFAEVPFFSKPSSTY